MGQICHEDGDYRIEACFSLVPGGWVKILGREWDGWAVVWFKRKAIKSFKYKQYGSEKGCIEAAKKFIQEQKAIPYE